MFFGCSYGFVFDVSLGLECNWSCPVEMIKKKEEENKEEKREKEIKVKVEKVKE